MPLDLYYNKLCGSCRAVLMVIKDLNLTVNIKHLDLSVNEQLAPDFVKLNPLHTVPTLVDNGFVLWESRAIMQYLVNQYAPDSKLYPKDPKKRALVDRALNFDYGLTQHFLSIMFAKLMTESEAPQDKKDALNNNLKTLDQLIGDNKYVVTNHLTIADLSLLAITINGEWIQYDLSDYPNYQRWFSSLKNELKYYEEVNSITKEELETTTAKYKAKLLAAAAAAK